MSQTLPLPDRHSRLSKVFCRQRQAAGGNVHCPGCPLLGDGRVPVLCRAVPPHAGCLSSQSGGNLRHESQRGCPSSGCVWHHCGRQAAQLNGLNGGTLTVHDMHSYILEEEFPRSRVVVFHTILTTSTTMPRAPPAPPAPSLPILSKASLPIDQLTQVQRRLAHLLNSLGELQGHVSTAQTLEEW